MTLLKKIEMEKYHI